jgi:heme-degrading monooxygenase HmoA
VPPAFALSPGTSGTMASMFACSFISRKKAYDEEFHRLDASIDAYAQSLDGYIGVDRWFSDDGKVQNSIYYWRDMDAVSVFARFPDHLEAKEKYAQWYEGYQIVISEVTASYGDGNIPHITSAK